MRNARRLNIDSAPPATITLAPPGGNLSRGVEHGLQAATAAAVDLQPRYAGAQAGVECGDPPDGRCFAAGVSVAEDDVVDVALTEIARPQRAPAR